MAFFFLQMSDGESTHEWSMGAPFPSFEHRSSPPSIRDRILRGQAFPTLTSPWVVPQIDDTIPTPASALALSLIQRSVVLDETPSDCAICLDSIQKGQNVAKMPCDGGHMFHDKCVSEWLKTRNTCPICRFALEAELQQTAFDIDDLDDSTSGWIRYTDYHLLQGRHPTSEHIPMAEPLPVAEAMPYVGDAAPWDDDNAPAHEEEHERWDAADERWGVGMGIGVGHDGAIVVTELVPGGPAERSAQVVPQRGAARGSGLRR
jgi:hypothetical protein